MLIVRRFPSVTKPVEVLEVMARGGKINTSPVDFAD
jgi:hypothetical protein